jgi:succinate dehydrogenase / fumarate reductase cytochrome b subunit
MDNPTSPHLQIYRIQLTSALSILHRLSGVFSFGGIILIILWLHFAACGKESLAYFIQMLDLKIFKFLLWAIMTSWFFHSINGVRYLVWSLAKGINITNVNKTGFLVIASTVIFSFFISWRLFSGG